MRVGESKFPFCLHAQRHLPLSYLSSADSTNQVIIPHHRNQSSSVESITSRSILQAPLLLHSTCIDLEPQHIRQKPPVLLALLRSQLVHGSPRDTQLLVSNQLAFSRGFGCKKSLLAVARCGVEEYVPGLVGQLVKQNRVVYKLK